MKLLWANRGRDELNLDWRDFGASQNASRLVIDQDLLMKMRLSIEVKKLTISEQLFI